MLWSVDDLRAPLAEGRTLDDLGLQAGDRIVLPQAGSSVTDPIVERLVRNVPFFLLSAFLGASIR